MVNQVDVRINDADTVEISNLRAILESMEKSDLRNNFRKDSDKNDWVVTVKPGKLQTLKETLRAILGIVKPERIMIET